MSDKHKECVYISGAISGNANYMAEFTAAKDAVEARGYRAVSPAHLVRKEDGKLWEDYMAEALDLLDGCNCVLLLPNWRQSMGARLERAIAIRQGKRIFYEADEL